MFSKIIVVDNVVVSEDCLLHFSFSIFRSLYPTSLCAQRSSKKCTSIACWTARFFLRKKLSKKAFYLFGLDVLPLVTAFGSWFKVILFAILVPLRLPRIVVEGNPAIS